MSITVSHIFSSLSYHGHNHQNSCNGSRLQPSDVNSKHLPASSTYDPSSTFPDTLRTKQVPSPVSFSDSNTSALAESVVTSRPNFDSSSTVPDNFPEKHTPLPVSYLDTHPAPPALSVTSCPAPDSSPAVTGPRAHVQAAASPGGHGSRGCLLPLPDPTLSSPACKYFVYSWYLKSALSANKSTAWENVIILMRGLPPITALLDISEKMVTMLLLKVIYYCGKFILLSNILSLKIS